MDTKALVDALTHTTDTLRAQALGVVVDYPIEGHPRVAHLLITREDDSYTVVITSPEGNAVRPQEIDAEVTDLLASAFPTAVGHLPVEGAAALLRGYSDEAEELINTTSLSNLLEQGTVLAASGISEPGYPCGPKGVLLANWNGISMDFQEWLESEGYTLHWEDEWTTCDDCGRIFRTVSDSYSWQQYGHIDQEGLSRCGACILADPESYLRAHEGSYTHAITLAPLKPEDHGYVKANPEEFVNGWHPGQDDRPENIARAIRGAGAARFLFKLVGVAQFEVHFDVYVHEQHRQALPAVQDALRRLPA